MEPGNRPTAVLVYTRAHGWIVCQPWWGDPAPELFGRSRPGGFLVRQSAVLATHPLPPPPEKAM